MVARTLWGSWKQTPPKLGLKFVQAVVTVAPGQRIERYFTEAGFTVLAMEGIDVPFAEVPKLSPSRIIAHIKNLLERHSDAQAIYLLGSAWRTLDIIQTLEQDCGLAVVHPGPARWWETLIRLGVGQSIPGYGKLLEELPNAAPIV